MKENFGGLHLKLSLGDTAAQAQPVSMEVDLPLPPPSPRALNTRMSTSPSDVVAGTIIGQLKLDALARGVQGPLYQPSCGFVSDELGNAIPGDCACRFPGATVVVPLYIPLGPLFGDGLGDGLGDGPVEPPAATDAGALP